MQTTDLGSETRAISLIGNPWESMGVYFPNCHERYECAVWCGLSDCVEFWWIKCTSILVFTSCVLCDLWLFNNQHELANENISFSMKQPFVRIEGQNFNKSVMYWNRTPCRKLNKLKLWKQRLVQWPTILQWIEKILMQFWCEHNEHRKVCKLQYLLP